MDAAARIEELEISLQTAIGTIHSQNALIAELVTRTLQDRGDADEWIAVREYIVDKWSNETDPIRIAMRNHIRALLEDIRERLDEQPD